MISLWWIVPFLFSRNVAAQIADDDLLTFITRPEIRAPKFDITYHDRRLVTPGYWFVAPYTVLEMEPPTKKWMPCQVGPHIYDGDGNLVWSGSCLFENRNTFDFKAIDNIDNNTHVSFIVQQGYQQHGDKKGGAIVLDGRLEYEDVVPVTNDLGAFDIHEFNVLEGGKTALATAYRPEFLDYGELGRPDDHGWVHTGGFVELDVATGDVVYEWRSLGHIPLEESTFPSPEPPVMDPPGWDYIHVNSVDKNADGDYLLSCRFTDTIYLISGATGDIIWRLGGKWSNFEFIDFRFYRQHHARFVEHNSTHTTISFLNNASDEQSQDDIRSSALIVQLDTVNMKATVVHRYGRPDGGLSRLRGNVQLLKSGNIFVGWSEQGYHSEFTPDGTCAMEARFTSDRYSTYRAYKYDFHGRPAEPPALKAFVYGAKDTDVSTVIYVSWNGATDVASWNFFAQADAASPRVLIGNVPYAGFETMFIADGYMNWISAEPLDADGNPMGMSDVHESSVPPDWAAAGYHADNRIPVPEDPMAVTSSEHEEEVEDKEEAQKAADKAYDFVGGIGGLLIFVLVACSAGGIVACFSCCLKRRTRRSYAQIPLEETVATTPITADTPAQH
ncbi:hypothetical protein DTO207G8_3878 [Paecilomyces variotii]|nr:hypothetical protein DTO207G8_3878 [Paecilomyces variotii]